MKTVLYIDDVPLLLSDIKRNKSYNRIVAGHVVNGDWELRLSATTIYAFEDYSHQGLRLRSECEYTTYEEVSVDAVGDYNVIINAANELRIKK